VVSLPVFLFGRQIITRAKAFQLLLPVPFSVFSPPFLIFGFIQDLIILNLIHIPKFDLPGKINSHNRLKFQNFAYIKFNKNSFGGTRFPLTKFFF